MANRARGEVDVTFGDEVVTLTLGLRTLAEIEDAFGVESFEDAFRLIVREDGTITARSLMTFMGAVLKGARASPAAVLAAERMAPGEFMDVLNKLLTVSGIMASDVPPEGESDKRPLGGKSAGVNGKRSASATLATRRTSSGR
jgi:hypothetical protein